ncbi:hypothetical protein HPB47_022373 [Ixodes persulcatus]|uniref:Uncharacterized protein n=1 Tax=Ixodes persulcatus TaxID=34615 RepID=A0AC60QD90_IXOPE|nr:hypothetical protein HPB47_022373 [Ixodes persulcatus]
MSLSMWSLQYSACVQAAFEGFVMTALTRGDASDVSDRRAKRSRLPATRLARQVSPSGAPAKHYKGRCGNGMVAVWSHSMDKRPGDRTEDDLESIYGRLRSIKAFHRLHPVLLQQLCFFGYYEDLDRGVTLFRQGDRGSNWYTVLAGSLDVQVTHTGHSKRKVPNGGAFFINRKPHFRKLGSQNAKLFRSTGDALYTQHLLLKDRKINGNSEVPRHFVTFVWVYWNPDQRGGQNVDTELDQLPN